jgi:hypothetical protein
MCRYDLFPFSKGRKRAGELLERELRRAKRNGFRWQTGYPANGGTVMYEKSYPMSLVPFPRTFKYELFPQFIKFPFIHKDLDAFAMRISTLCQKFKYI